MHRVRSAAWLAGCVSIAVSDINLAYLAFAHHQCLNRKEGKQGNPPLLFISFPSCLSTNWQAAQHNTTEHRGDYISGRGMKNIKYIKAIRYHYKINCKCNGKQSSKTVSAFDLIRH